jgi:double-stranded RNA-binding protein Staufen
LEVLKPLTVDNDTSKTSIAGSSIGDHESGSGDDSIINSDIKSPISMVHEMALKRKLTVTFEVQSEKGPPHMKVYTTLCKVGTIVVRSLTQKKDSCNFYKILIHFLSFSSSD